MDIEQESLKLLMHSVNKATQLEMMNDELVPTSAFLVLFDGEEAQLVCIENEYLEHGTNHLDVLHEIQEALKKNWDPVGIILCEGADAEKDDFCSIAWLYFSDEPSVEHRAIMDSLHEFEQDEPDEYDEPDELVGPDDQADGIA